MGGCCAPAPRCASQEIYALLIVYQLLRTVIADAALVAGVDPDRASFTIAFTAARDQLIQAANIIADTTIDVIGVIGTKPLSTSTSARGPALTTSPAPLLHGLASGGKS